MREGNITPKMENGKCMENCTWRDEHGFCTNGDACIKYGVNNVTGVSLRQAPYRYEVEDDYVRADGAMSLLELNSRLGYQLRNLMDRTKSEKEHQRDVQDALVTATLAKSIIQTVNMALNAPKALRSYDRGTRDSLRKLIE